MPYSSPADKRDHQRRWQAQRRADWFRGKSCVRCGATSDLELDHVDRATKVSHSIWSWSAERMHEELAKCQVLCATCHHEKTLAENEACGMAPWTRQQCVEAITAFVERHGRAPSQRTWRADPEARPSDRVIRRLFGSWSMAIVEAGFALVPVGRPPQGA